MRQGNDSSQFRRNKIIIRTYALKKYFSGQLAEVSNFFVAELASLKQSSLQKLLTSANC